jgi:TnpA family transposase
MKLYLPDKGTAETYALLEPALTRPIRWELISQQYDPMIRYATAIRLGTASTEAILRRFTRDVTHPRLRGHARAGPRAAHHLPGPVAARP